MSGFNDFSTTAASNSSIGGQVWAEGQLPSTVNNSARQLLADLADVRDGNVVATGWHVKANGLTVRDQSDTTKKVIFDASAVSAGSTRTVGFINAGGNVVLDTATQTLTNKTINPTSNSLKWTPSPQGRLTLVSATPVLTSDQTAKTTIYYTPYVGNLIPLYDGTDLIVSSFSELSVTLDTTNFTSGNLYDLYVASDSGTLRLGYGPAWSSSTSRGTGAGTTELQRVTGVWTNKVSITLRYDSTHTFTASANYATYVGTAYATADGQTGMALKPTAASGGTGNVLGLWNAYNRVVTRGVSRDSTATWTYDTASFRAANSSTSNRVSWIDGLGESAIETVYSLPINASGSTVHIGVKLDATTSADARGTAAFSVGTTAQTIARATYTPQLGFHYVQAVEISDSSISVTFSGNGNDQSLDVCLEM